MVQAHRKRENVANGAIDDFSRRMPVLGRRLQELVLECPLKIPVPRLIIAQAIDSFHQVFHRSTSEFGHLFAGHPEPVAGFRL